MSQMCQCATGAFWKHRQIKPRGLAAQAVHLGIDLRIRQRPVEARHGDAEPGEEGRKHFPIADMAEKKIVGPPRAACSRKDVLTLDLPAGPGEGALKLAEMRQFVRGAAEIVPTDRRMWRRAAPSSAEKARERLASATRET